MKNRYGDEYEYVPVNENTYHIKGELKYWRFGGKEGEESINMDSLGMCDPSGGPYIELGMKVMGREVVRIYVNESAGSEPAVYLEVK